MTIHDVTYFDFDREEDSMRDGVHMDVVSVTLQGAVTHALHQLADYEEGTEGYEAFKKVTEVCARNDYGTATAYRVSDTEWEMHWNAEINNECVGDCYTFEV